MAFGQRAGSPGVGLSNLTLGRAVSIRQPRKEKPAHVSLHYDGLRVELPDAMDVGEFCASCSKRVQAPPAVVVATVMPASAVCLASGSRSGACPGELDSKCGITSPWVCT